ncbi:S-adenosyl-L-methionine dependent methyltransferase [Daedalea quercina L-15889]|uniref:S-adenosyl-L-methionine dependent methyltransferase n=1 Tax=Daedalea quercina L-15889 TaxID=1314783 RepID=A0A165N2R4_9APHY|nr:S-adenosyl-L-methionine dependent methyltransferase [Daedalea quercina L-15889]
MDPSARVYSRFNLRLYDILVLVVSNSWAWRCSTTSVLLPFFRKNLGTTAHMDVGVGSGYYLAKSARAMVDTESVTLLDLNQAALNVASARIRQVGYQGTVDTVEHNVFRLLPDDLHGRFDAVSLMYVLHCLPGRMNEKGPKVFANLSAALKPDAVLYGSTILGRGPEVSHNWFGKWLMGLYNRKGIFDNTEDTLDDLKQVLRVHFEDVDIKMVGVVAIFEVRRPRVG